MAVHINGLSGSAVRRSAGSSSQVKSKQGGGSTSSTSLSGSDRVTVSNSAAQLQELESYIASLPVVNSALVETIQLALATGDYQVDHEESAEKLLEQERKLP